jgi:hypothetical protein
VFTGKLKPVCSGRESHRAISFVDCGAIVRRNYFHQLVGYLNGFWSHDAMEIGFVRQGKGCGKEAEDVGVVRVVECVLTSK